MSPTTGSTLSNLFRHHIREMIKVIFFIALLVTGILARPERHRGRRRNDKNGFRGFPNGQSQVGNQEFPDGLNQFGNGGTNGTVGQAGGQLFQLLQQLQPDTFNQLLQLLSNGQQGR
ncbi:uncharacterized protein LOC111089417 [Limulus polyphemus]|uniref:Uncharacterized protein LOC111089417 n=1 Tax=Limulus polyphemus TaxID=6850 RepID=A0ABM1TNX4_LIMPO|nr:uncharacterized protein LOC111089417 [Limulus polyphemus]